MGSTHDSNFCSNCGSAVDPTDDFCSDCGSAIGGSAIRRSATSKANFQRRVDSLTAQGWEIKHDYGDRVVLVNRGFGSWGIHALLLVFTGGLGNAVYAWYNYFSGADRIELRRDGTERYLSGGPADGSSGGWGEFNAKTISTSIIFALIGISMLSDIDSAVSAFLAISFIGASLFTFPPTRRRFQDREPVTKFGQVRSTTEEIATEPDIPCTACSRPVENGVKRTFRERTCVAGIPLVTNDEGENYYCRSCANGDPFSVDTNEKSRDKLKER